MQFPHESSSAFGHLIRICGNIAIWAVGGRGLTYKDFVSNRQEIWDLPAGRDLKRKERLARRWGFALAYLWHDQRIHIYTLSGHSNLLVGRDEDWTSEFFSKIERLYCQMIAVLHINRGQHNDGQSATISPAQKLDVPICTPGGRSC